ncbi:PAS domain S-box protein, partial [Halorubrum pallidum]
MSRGAPDDRSESPSEGFCTSFLEGSTDPILSVDADGAVTYANPAAERTLGYDASDLLGRRLGSLIPEDVPRARSLRERLATPPRLVDGGDVAIPLGASDGTVQSFSARFHEHDPGDGPVYTGVFRECTDPDRGRDFRTYRNLIEHAGHAIYVTDTDGTIEYVNPAFSEHTGYEPEEAVGETPAILNSDEMPPDYFDSLWETIRSGGVWEEEIVDRKKDGTLYHAHQTIAPVFDGDGGVSRFVAIQTDITDRKAAEGRLKQYRDVVERLADPILLQNRDGEFVLLNEAVSEFAGVPREDLYGADETAFMDEETAVEIADRRREVLETEGPAEYEVSPTFPESGRDATFRTQRYPYYDGDGELTGTFAICHDVTELKRRETDLTRYERAVEGATDLIAAIDRNGQFLFANEQYRSYHGIGAEMDISDLTLADVVDDEQYPDVNRQVRRALSGQTVEYRTTRTHPARGTRRFDARYYPLGHAEDGASSVDGVVGVLRDVTDSENRAHQLRVVDRVLQHNLRNAMTVVRGRAKQLAEWDDPAVANAADDVVDRAAALLSTSEKAHHITEVLSDPPETEPLDVTRIVEEIAEAVASEFPEASVSVSTPDGPATASATTGLSR